MFVTFIEGVPSNPLAKVAVVAFPVKFPWKPLLALTLLPLMFPLALIPRTSIILKSPRLKFCVAVWFPKLSAPAAAAANEADVNLPPPIFNSENEPVDEALISPLEVMCDVVLKSPVSCSLLPAAAANPPTPILSCPPTLALNKVASLFPFTKNVEDPALSLNVPPVDTVNVFANMELAVIVPLAVMFPLAVISLICKSPKAVIFSVASILPVISWFLDWSIPPNVPLLAVTAPPTVNLKPALFESSLVPIPISPVAFGSEKNIVLL